MDANHSRRTNLFVVSTVEELERARVAENYVFHLFKSQTRLHACLQDIGSLLSGMDGLIGRLVEGTGRTLVRNGIVRIAIGIAHQHYDQNHTYGAITVDEASAFELDSRTIHLRSSSLCSPELVYNSAETRESGLSM